MGKEVILDFINAINSANIERMVDLMTDDHEFTDTQDNKMSGKENLRKAWKVYFELFPDYKIEVNEILEKGDLICLLGHASATYKNMHNENNSNYWRIPAAWKAILENNLVKRWQVYADNIIVMDVINKNK
jgi:ketosteroid isomerase-like protein